MSSVKKCTQWYYLSEILESNSFHITYCFLSGLGCLLPLCLQLQSNIEQKLLRQSLSSTPEFAFTSIASITAVVPLFFDVFLDLVAVMRSENISSPVRGKRSKPPTTKPTQFTFLNIPERMLILMGVTILPFVALLPTQTANLGLIYLCCNKCQQCWVGGTVALSLSRYDKEYWSIKSTLISLISFSIGLIGGPFIDNIHAGQNPPGLLITIVDYGIYLFTIIPILLFMVNSIRWLLIVYLKFSSWKKYVMCRSDLVALPQIESQPVDAGNTADHTFFPMIYTLSGISVIVLLSVLIATSSRIDNYSGRDLWLSNLPFLVFVILLSTLSMRLVKFEVVQGLVSFSTALRTVYLTAISSTAFFELDFNVDVSLSHSMP